MVSIMGIWKNYFPLKDLQTIDVTASELSILTILLSAFDYLQSTDKMAYCSANMNEYCFCGLFAFKFLHLNALKL